jgi:hypothetical protein
MPVRKWRKATWRHEVEYDLLGLLSNCACYQSRPHAVCRLPQSIFHRRIASRFRDQNCVQLCNRHMIELRPPRDSLRHAKQGNGLIVGQSFKRQTPSALIKRVHRLLCRAHFTPWSFINSSEAVKTPIPCTANRVRLTCWGKLQPHQLGVAVGRRNWRQGSFTGFILTSHWSDDPLG